MQSRIVLISEDSDFYDYISPKLVIRKSDELFRFKFQDLPDKIYLLSGAVLLINAEGAQEQTIELLSLLKESPAIVFGFNENDEFKTRVLKNGAYAFITPLIPDEEFEAYLSGAFNFASVYTKNKQYRELLVSKNMIHKNNEVLVDYNDVLDRELTKLHNASSSAILMAISPNDKSKFLLQPNQIETIILNNIRKNDILMSYAVNKYFLLLFDIDMECAQKIWDKISSQIPEKIYAGFVKTFSKTRQQLVNEALNKLHEAINYENAFAQISSNSSSSNINNFKMFKQEFSKKVENIINPVFYLIKQKYTDKLFGITLEQEITDRLSVLYLKGRHTSAEFKITYPGFSTVNIDVKYLSSKNQIEPKRISLKPDEFEVGLLEDLIEQFIEEFKLEVNNV